MRAALTLVLCLAVFGCMPGGGEPESAASGPSDGYVLDDPPPGGPDGVENAPSSSTDEAAEDAPVPPPEVEVVEEAPPEDDVFSAARAACLAEGGRFGRAAGGGARVCFRTPEDANRPCRTGAECEGACLARSRTCAPLVPLLGCHEVILSSGRVATECVE